MKSLQSLLGILIFTSLFTACPIFGADDQGKDNQAQDEQEGIMQRLIGPGSLPQGLCGYFAILPGRPYEEKKDVLLGSMGVVSLAICISYLWKSDYESEKFYDLYFGAVAIASGAIAAKLLVNVPEKVGFMRNMQKVQANKPVEDRDIKKYINALLDMCRENGYNPFVMQADLRQNFLENYPRERLPQLQNCAEQVLIETGRCRKKGDNSGIECVDSPQVNLGPVWEEVVFVQFSLLNRILRNEGNEENAVEGQGYEDRLNVLLGHISVERSMHIRKAK